MFNISIIMIHSIDSFSKYCQILSNLNDFDIFGNFVLYMGNWSKELLGTQKKKNYQPR